MVVDQEEISANFVSNSPSYESFSSSRWSNSKRFEKLRMSQRIFEHFTDLSEFFPATTDIIISSFILMSASSR